MVTQLECTGLKNVFYCGLAFPVWVGQRRSRIFVFYSQAIGANFQIRLGNLLQTLMHAADVVIKTELSIGDWVQMIVMNR